MIRHLAYVCCDQCGAPAGGTEDVGRDAREARRNARNFGFRLVLSAHSRGLDLCPSCQPPAGTAPASATAVDPPAGMQL